jgi:hypothetical protein
MNEANLSDDPAVGTLHRTACYLQELECPMSKRKPSTATKHARSPKIAAKAQRAPHAIVRSPKNSRLRSAVGDLIKAPRKRPDDSQTEPLLVENPVRALQDDDKQRMTDSDSQKRTNFSLTTANVRAYQAKLLKWHKSTCNSLFNLLKSLRRLGRLLNFLVSSQNSPASGSLCSGSRKKWLN